MSAITIDNLATAKFEAGKSYQIAEREHVITSPIALPDNVSVYADLATIVYDNPARPPVWSVFKKKNVAILGGKYKIGAQNYAAFIEHSENCRLKYAWVGCVEDNATQHSGGLVIVRGSSNTHIYQCTARTVNRYFIFCEGNNNGVLIEDCALYRGSIEEAGIRIRDSKNVTLLNNSIYCQIAGAKNSALRMQDGENFQVISGVYGGGFGAGPLADGDGGRNETDPAKRADKINRRLKRVLVRDVIINGPVTLEAGLEGYRHIGGRVRSKQIFAGTTWRYPEKDEWTKPCDIVRVQAQGAMTDVNLEGEVADNPIDIIDCRSSTQFSIPAVKK